VITLQSAAILTETITAARSIVVALGSNPNYDAVSSALALHLSFLQAGKASYIVCAAPMRVEFSYLVGVDQIKEKLGNRNLTVSFPYDEQSVDKVSYHLSPDNTRFNLVIAPKGGGKPLDPSQVQYEMSGAEADLIVMVGVAGFEDLGGIYASEQHFFESVYGVSITSFQIQPFSRMAYDTSGQSSLAEGVAVLLEGWGLPLQDDVSTNLLSSIEQATQRFQSLGVGADTFELVARLMRNGARRSASNPTIHGQQSVDTASVPPMMAGQGQGVIQPVAAPQVSASISQATPANTSTFAEALKKRVVQPAYNVLQHAMQPQQQAPQYQINQIEHTDQQTNMQQENQPQMTPPADWMQPKIFTGASKV
jgi:hypothetical protein